MGAHDEITTRQLDAHTLWLMNRVNELEAMIAGVLREPRVPEDIRSDLQEAMDNRD
jgi:hypothetical protein